MLDAIKASQKGYKKNFVVTKMGHFKGIMLITRDRQKKKISAWTRVLVFIINLTFWTINFILMVSSDLRTILGKVELTFSHSTF